MSEWTINLDSPAVECGQLLRGSIRGIDQSAAPDVRLVRRLETRGDHGDGETTESVVATSAIDATARFALDVPESGPITLAGKLIKVSWLVAAGSDDGESVTEPVTVLPRAGLALWAQRVAGPPTS